MAKRIGQIRYQRTDQSTIGAAGLINGDAFTYPIIQLGIQATPGTRVLLNSNNKPIIIGATGIYELDIDGLAKITKIQFAQSSINNMPIGSYIIVDYVYDQEQ